MPQRMCSFLAVLCLVAVPARGRSDEAKAEKAKAKTPTLVVQLRSFEDLRADLQYVFELGGNAEQAKQLDRLIKSQAGREGLKGIDTKRPLGLYGILEPDVVNSTAVGLVPVADEKAVLGLIEDLGQKAEKGDDGIYTISPEGLPFNIYLRFTNKYAYVTARDKAPLLKENLLDPSQVLSAKQAGTISAMVRLDQIPSGIKDLVLGQIDLQFANAKDREVPNETEAQRKLRIQFLDNLSQRVARVIQEGGALQFHFNVNRQAKHLTVEVSLAGESGSTLAKDITGMASSRSLFGGVVTADGAMNILAHFKVPADLHKAALPVLDQVFGKALKKARTEAERKAAEKFVKALEPSLKSGDIDTVMSFRGPNKDKQYTIVTALKLKDGQAVEQAVQNMIKNLPEADRDKIKREKETAGDAQVYRIEAQKSFDRSARQVLGANPIYLAFRDNAVVAVAGPDGLATLKEALTASPKAEPPILFEMALARLAPLMARNNPQAARAAKEAFTDEKGHDTVRLTIEGGKALKIHLVLEAQAVKFLGLTSRYARAAAVEQHGAAERARDQATRKREEDKNK